MAQTLREILDAREREVRRMLDEVQRKQVEPLQRELADIVSARTAIGANVPSQPPPPLVDDADRYKRMKYEDLALLALKDGFPNGATLQEVLDHIRTEFGREISQGSFSPTLSRLRQKRLLTKNGHAWILEEGN
jgi:hypothetical protein